MNETIDYYNNNAEKYFNKTVNVSMQAVYEQFEVYLKPGDKILDLGCGSGRDSKYFLDKGYDVTSVDGAKELCYLAEKYLGRKILNLGFEELEFINEFDAVWACASLLHVDASALVEVLGKIKNALKDEGIIYASWKYGQGERVDNQKYYMDFNEATILQLFSSTAFDIKRIWVTEDNLVRDCKWVNVIGGCKKI